MVVSQNGWTANDRSVIVSYDLPGGKLALRRGPAGQVLAYVGRRWHAEVEPLQWPGCWGYAERAIRGGVQTSNHASGTAADYCAPRHPLGTNPSANFSAGQIAAVHRILADCGGLIRWGGDYVGRKDGMHVEVNDGVSEARLGALWARLSGQSPPAPPPPASGSVVVATLQRALHFVGAEVDGVWGQQTDAGFATIRHAINGQFDLPGGVKEAQTRVGAPTDGQWGSASRAALGRTIATLQTVWNDAPANGVWRDTTQRAFERDRAAYFRG